MKLDPDRLYEVTPAGLVPILQGLSETENAATYLEFGELKTKKLRPIEETCKTCLDWSTHFSSIQECQAIQKKDAELRGFHKVTCPEQFIE